VLGHLVGTLSCPPIASPAPISYNKKPGQDLIYYLISYVRIHVILEQEERKGVVGQRNYVLPGVLLKRSTSRTIRVYEEEKEGKCDFK